MRRFLLSMVILLSCASAHAQWTTTTLTLTLPVTVDYWQYENSADPNGRTLGPSWVLPPDGDGSSRRHGMDVFSFNIPPVVDPVHILDITAAKLTFYDIPGSIWPPTGATTTDGYPSRLELFAAGFGPTYSESTWNGTQPMEAGEGTHDPYPRDKVTNLNVDDELFGTTPWVIGQPIGYTPGTETTAFPIEFTFDVNDTTTSLELMNDMTIGKSSWVFSSTHEIDFIGDPGTLPSAVMKEGLPYFPGSAAPTLRIDLIIEVPNSVQEWALYE